MTEETDSKGGSAQNEGCLKVAPENVDERRGPLYDVVDFSSDMTEARIKAITSFLLHAFETWTFDSSRLARWFSLPVHAFWPFCNILHVLCWRHVRRKHINLLLQLFYFVSSKLKHFIFLFVCRSRTVLAWKHRIVNNDFHMNIRWCFLSFSLFTILFSFPVPVHPIHQLLLSDLFWLAHKMLVKFVHFVDLFSLQKVTEQFNLQPLQTTFSLPDRYFGTFIKLLRFLPFCYNLLGLLATFLTVPIVWGLSWNAFTAIKNFNTLQAFLHLFLPERRNPPKTATSQSLNTLRIKSVAVPSVPSYFIPPIVSTISANKQFHRK